MVPILQWLTWGHQGFMGTHQQQSGSRRHACRVPDDDHCAVFCSCSPQHPGRCRQLAVGVELEPHRQLLAGHRRDGQQLVVGAEQPQAGRHANGLAVQRCRLRRALGDGAASTSRAFAASAGITRNGACPCAVTGSSSGACGERCGKQGRPQEQGRARGTVG
ncbi:hypothetical protein ACU4GD_44560 [Cupriavidus basilensis]